MVRFLYKSARDTRTDNSNLLGGAQGGGDVADGPANTRHRPNVRPMLGHHLRRWPNIGPTLGRYLVFAGGGSDSVGSDGGGGCVVVIVMVVVLIVVVIVC